MYLEITRHCNSIFLTRRALLNRKRRPPSLPPPGQSVAVHFQGTSAAVMGGMFLAGLGVESYMLGQVISIHQKQDEQEI